MNSHESHPVYATGGAPPGGIANTDPLFAIDTAIPPNAQRYPLRRSGPYTVPDSYPLVRAKGNS